MQNKKPFTIMGQKVYILTLLSLIFVGCVGQVENTENEQTFFEDPQVSRFTFTGLLDAKPISHHKVELDFVSLGEDYDYFLVINESPESKKKLDLDTVQTTPSGTYRYTVDDLTIGTSYTFKISATNKKTGALSQNESKLTVSTFDNQVANFNGITEVNAIPGQSSTSAIVSWNKATFTGALQATSYDPSFYEVFYIEKSQGYENLFNRSLTNVVPVPSSGAITPSNHDSNTQIPITTLLPSTEYYFGVRAVHKLYANDDGSMNLNSDSNTKFVEYETQSPLGAVDFDKSSLEIQNAVSQDAFRKVLAFWAEGQGTFYGYRMFIKKFEGSDLLNSDELEDEYITELDGGGDYKNLIYDSGSPCENVTTASSGQTEASIPNDLQSDATKVACFNLSPDLKNLRIANLEAYTGYHFKMALCQTQECPLEETSPDVGILSNIAPKRTLPTLAPFNGIKKINNPTDISATDQITANFDSILTSLGYADTFEMYCLDPNNYASFTKFPNNGTAISASGVGNCDGLSAMRDSGGTLSQLDSFTTIDDSSKVKISGINANGSTQYCFAITPAITDRPDAPVSEFGYDAQGELRINPSDWTVRCKTPEFQTPTVEEFPGLTSGCQVNKDEATLSWEAPTAGLYHDYLLFYKLKDGSPFSFSDALAGAPEYSSVTLPKTTTSHTINSFTPGSTYSTGIITRLSTGPDDFYSEANGSIFDCKMPMPLASFQEWTRLFAIGPKTDGRLPDKQSTDDNNPWPTFRNDSDSTVDARIYESLNPQGQPYEVNSLGDIDLNPPGEIRGSFTPTNPNTYDGVPSSDGSLAFATSRNGIVSLAWREVVLDFKNDFFKDQQSCSSDGDAGLNGYCDHKIGVDKNERKYGYRVYRSQDYGLNWENLTKKGESGEDERLVHTIDYSYRTSPSLTAQTDKMGFFTDYSVLFTPSEGPIDRARVYLYKIVPIFNGKEITYSGNSTSPHHIVRITLPPANQALVHRKMANRSLCMEVGKYDEIEIDNNYRCPWNGLGAKFQGAPFALGNTGIDQGGDLIVDRFELGCRFTRGDLNTNYQNGQSFYHRDESNNGSWTDLFTFRGVRTSQFDGSDTSIPFMGCTSKYINDSGEFRPNGASQGSDPYDLADDPYSGNEAEYSKTVYGDCLGADVTSVPRRYCPSGNSGCLGGYTYTFPGANSSGALRASPGSFDNTQSLPNRPQFAFGNDRSASSNYRSQSSDSSTGRDVGLLDRDFRKNMVAQGEFGAVFHNHLGGRTLPVYSQGYSNSEDNHEVINSGNTSLGGSGCFLNLPSIDNDGTWRSRWLSLADLSNIVYHNQEDGVPADQARENILDKTLSEIRASKALYDNNFSDSRDLHYRDPLDVNMAFLNTDRLHLDMPLGRIMTSNSAKLPVLRRMSQAAAQATCSAYKVQVGIADDDANFQALGSPKAKGLLSRTDHIVASAYPDHEDFNASLINRLERGNGTLSLNTENLRTCKGAEHPYDTNFDMRINRALRANYAEDVVDTSPFMSGTGRLDENFNSQMSTENCQSRYGVQDLVGNANEINLNRIFCDYSTDNMALYFGGDGSLSDSVELPYVNPNSQAYRTYYATDAEVCRYFQSPPGGAWILDQTNVAFDGQNYDIYCRTGNEPWKFQSVNAGYCSVVDNDDDRPVNPGNFRDGSGLFYLIQNSSGEVNSSMILAENTVAPHAPSFFRNGDGRFLNFGPANLSTSFLSDNSLSFATGNSENLFFNPLLGIPLSCNSYAPGVGSCDTNSSDNREYTLSSFYSHHPSGLVPPMKNDDFFIGNSAASSPGISETRSKSPFNVTFGLQNSSRLVTKLTEDPDGDVSLESCQGTGCPLGTRSVYRYHWSVTRGTIFNFTSGGHANATSGRYTASIQTAGQTGGNNSTRCSVLVNQDGY